MTIASRLNPEELKSLVSRLRFLSLTLAASALASAVVCLFILMNTNNGVMTLLIASHLLLFFTAISNVYDISRGELSNNWRMVIVAQVVYLFSSFFISGMGAWYGIAAGALTLAFIAQMPRSEAHFAQIPIWVPISAVVSGVSTYLVDLYWPLQRFIFFAPWQAYQLAAVLLPSLVYALFSFYNFGTRPLRIKLVTTFALVSAIAVLPIVGYLNFSNRNTLIQRESEKLLSAAQQVANELDLFIDSVLLNIKVESSFNDFRDYLELDPFDRQFGWDTLIHRTMLELTQRDPNNIVSYAILDAEGNVIADTTKEEVGINFAQTIYFTETMQTGQLFVSPVLAELNLRNFYEYFIYFAAPIRNEDNAIIGILRVKYKAGVLQDIVKNYNNQAGLSSFAILTDQNNIRLGHGRDSSQLYQLLAPTAPEIYTQLLAERRVPVGSQESIATQLVDFDQKLRTSSVEPVFTTLVGLDLASARGEIGDVNLSRAAVAHLRTQPWKVTFSQEESITLQPLQVQSRVVGVLVLGIGFLLAILSVGVSSLFVNPVNRLTQAASQIAQGNFDPVVKFRSYDDEFGMLARTFNDMAAQIRQSVITLETRVTERTRDLELRAFQLQTAAETGNIVSTIRDLDKLLPEVAILLSDRFGFYHVGIFLLDETKEYAVLQASNSQGGQRMLSRGHRLRVGETGIVGYVTATGQPRISLDVGEDAVFFNNPDLPTTRSEMALPLIARGKVIGALDIQSDEENAFSEADVTVLRVVAEQVAVTIENARLFIELESAAEATRRAYGEVTARAWADYAEKQAVHGYITRSSDVVIPVSEQLSPAMVSAMKDLRSGSVVQLDTHTLIVPIKFRDLVLGAIRLQREPKYHAWTSDETASLQNLADQLGAALENARLYRETQRAASRDRMVREIGDRMRRAPDMDALIQTAIREMSRVLGADQAFAQISLEPQLVVGPTSGNGGNRDGDHGQNHFGEMA